MSADVRGGLSTESCGHGRGRNSADADAKISASAQSLTVTSLPQHILKVMTAWSLCPSGASITRSFISSSSLVNTRSSIFYVRQEQLCIGVLMC